MSLDVMEGPYRYVLPDAWSVGFYKYANHSFGRSLSCYGHLNLPGSVILRSPRQLFSRVVKEFP